MRQSGHVSLEIYNQVGWLAATITDSKGSGWQSSQLSVGKYAAGVYYSLLTIHYHDGSQESQGPGKFVVLH